MKIKVLAIVIAGIVVVFPDRTPAEAEPDPQLADVISSLRENRAFHAIQLLDEGVARGSIPAGVAAQFMAVSGDPARAEALLHSPAPARPATAADVPEFSDLSMAPAIAAIVRAAQSSSIVMLNEDHAHQRHRAFAHDLLVGLRAVGFTHFGAETFSENIVNSLTDGAPDTGSGIYTFDPIYADLARQAKAMGYSIFPYEQRPGQELEDGTGEDLRQAREQAQAENILAILGSDPDARIFVYAGSGHISEGIDVAGRQWMARILKDRSGLDPLTVNQVHGTPRRLPELDRPLYRAVESFRGIEEPVVVRNGGDIVTLPGFDLVVFHPRERFFHGRPDWMSMEGYRKRCRLKLEPRSSDMLARAFVASEPDDSIPMDQILLPAGSQSVEFRLPEGDYSVIRQDADGDHPEGQVQIAAHADACRRIPVVPADRAAKP